MSFATEHDSHGTGKCSQIPLVVMPQSFPYFDPRGGGGPGMRPIGVVEHLVPFLPGHPRCAGEWRLVARGVGGALGEPENS